MIRLFKLLWWSFVAIFCGLLLSLSGAYLYLSPSLPSVDSLRSIKLQMPLRVFSSDHKLIAEFGEMRRAPIRFEDIPQDFIHALLAAEDDNFANHYGVDVGSLMRAASQLLKSGQIQTGGSTITMQVAKNFFLTSERSFSRKINEILLALQIERELSKNEILELYVNKIYLGNRAYGIEAASQVYFGKSIRDTSLAEMAMIAGLPKAPSRANPLADPVRSKERRDWILGRMYKLGRIDEERYASAIAEPVNVSYHGATIELDAPYVAEMARAEMVGRYGSDAYTEGLTVITTVPSDLQSAATLAVRQGLISYDQRHGYRGPEAEMAGMSRDSWLSKLEKYRNVGGLEPVIVTQVEKSGILILAKDGQEEAVPWSSMKWARPFINSNSLGPRPKQPADVVQIGDLIRVQRNSDGTFSFSQIPAAQAALVSLNPKNGAIQALVGGFSFDQSNYNRATQAKRQPGSSFKPFIYSAALDKGFTASSVVNDSPIVFQTAGMDEAWRPKNDNNTFLGPIRLREALYRSRNLVSIRLLQAIGIDYTLEYLGKFGFNSNELPRNYSLALGTADLTPMEIATGWSTLANGGFKTTPFLIERIESREGQVLFRANPPIIPKHGTLDEDVAHSLEQPMGTHVPPETDSAPVYAERIVDARTIYILTNMLQDVIKRGTGRRALQMERSDIAGKTGTTNDSKDSWFSGYNADFITTVWVGFDQPNSLGHREYGGTVALPIWMSYMSTALKDKPPHMLPEPEGILTLRVDSHTGRIAAPGSSNAYWELFKSETTPAHSNEFGTPGEVRAADEDTPIDLF